MQTIGKATRVTIYIGERDRWGRKPLYSAILELLRQEDCAGATVVRGLAGFGAASRIHSASIVALSDDLPLVITWVDDPVRVERVLPRVVEMVVDGLIVSETVEVVTYSHRRLRELRTNAPVRDIMHREVISVAPQTPLSEAVELLLRHDFHALPVLDAGRHVVGILTDGDLLKRAGLLALSAQRALSPSELGRLLDDLRRGGQSVAVVMSPEPVTVGADTPIGQAIEIMLTRDVKRVPVVDAQGRLVGIVSRLDVLRALAQPPLHSPAEDSAPPIAPVAPGERRGPATRVDAVMIADVPAVTAEAPLTQVVALILSTAQRRVVVLDSDGRVVGIITDADLFGRVSETERAELLEALAGRARSDALRLASRSAGDVMTRHPISVYAGTPISEALRLLLTHRIKRLPVVDSAGRLLGLVGRGGILRALAEE